MRNSRLLLLAGLAASIVAEPIPLRARQTAAAVVRRQDVPDDCTLLDTADSKDEDCEYFSNLWGITVADFIAWNVTGAFLYPPVQEGIIDTCTSYHKAVSGDDCSKLTAKFGFTLADFIKWNPAVDETCAGFWLGYYYCVATPGSPTGTVTAGPEPTSTVPSPVQEGIIDTCTSYHKAVSGDDCSKLTAKFGFTLADFIKWNPAVDET
ncbi:hypothetical protein V498_05195, partial [Pseudogymnoascus sp. VKM F-4517 (FW-2822)]